MMSYLLVVALLSSCAAAIPPEPFLLYSNITNIHSLDLTTLARGNVIGGLDRAIPLGIDTVYKHIYLGEHTLGRIYRANYDGSSKTLIMKGVENIEGVAIDWIGRNIYFTTYKSGTIEVTKIDGKYRKVLINAGLEYPRGMAVDPNAGYLFWSDWGVVAAIERCSLDGSNRTVLVNNNITWPNGVTLDHNQKLVYWIDAYHDTIGSVDYDGNNRRVIFEDTSLALSQFHGFDLDITGSSVYFTDWLQNRIFGVNVNTGVVFRNITVPTAEFIKGAMGLRVVHSSKQQAGSSNCGLNNGGCEQLCFHKVPSGFSCGCQLGMMLNKDRKSCDDAFKDEFLMFADATAGKIYQMQLDSKNVKPIAVPFDDKANISRPVALEYDRVEDRVYWTDVTLRIICRAFRNGTGFEMLFDDVGVADGLTIDPAGRLLYWTSTTTNTIEVSRFDGSYRKVLIRYSLDEPRDIIVDAISGHMYWTDWGHTEKIERASMNGENRTDLVTKNLHWPNGLTIDHVYNKLYWADAGEDSIEGMDLTTMERRVILNKKFILFGFLFRDQTEVNHPFGITLLHDRMFWTDWNKEAVYSADVNTGANIVLMTANLGRPMDIHAYSAIPKEQLRLHYTFSFPNTGMNFTCHVGKSCPPMDPPPACPPGYKDVRENSTCGLYCRDIVGYTYRCPCNDWMSCAVKERYLWGCSLGYYSSFRVRECSQVVRPGRCPYDLSLGSQNACFNDSVCPGVEKCCDSKCVTPASIDSHPCQKNNGGCDQLCFAVPGGYKCGCKSDFYYEQGLKQCVLDTTTTTPTTVPPTTPPKTCTPLGAPDHGSVTCDGDPVPQWGYCNFKCDEGYELVGWSWDICLSGDWLDDVPTCKVSTKPKFSFCQNDTTVDTEPGKSYRGVYWIVPTATDYNGTELTVHIYPLEYTPPVKFSIGGPYYIDLTAKDDNGETVHCSFSYTVEDREPPSFGSTCPANITRYTENDRDYRLQSFTKPTATDNAKPPFVYQNGFPIDSYFPIGRTLVTYTARDDANLTAQCVFSVTIINVCSGKVCSAGSFCTMDTSTGNSHACVCKTVCPQINDPVCGTDGTTYNNECLMNVSSCITGRIITVASRGQCKRDEDCITKTCDPDKVCKVVAGKAQCVCDRSCPETHDQVCGSDVKTYDNECKLLEAKCNQQKDIYVLRKGKCGDCSTMNCRYGAQCEIQGGLAKCECDLACADAKTSVCGSDGRTYDDKCKMLKAQCIDQRPITKIKDSSCGCDNLEMNEAFRNTSELECKQTTGSQNSVNCTVKCQSGNNKVFSDFLKFQCYNKKWIRGNGDDNYVPITDAKTIPRCYKEEPQSQIRTCPRGYGPVKNLCVPCPPGSYNKESSCVPCDVAMYQDLAGQTSCKQCNGAKSSTTTGAESCYFDHGKSGVKMVFEDNKSDKASKDKIRKDIATGLTNLCKTSSCHFEDHTARRKRRATLVFTEDHVIIFSIKQDSSDTEVQVFVVDPSSESLIPDKAFKSKDLNKLIIAIEQAGGFSFTLKSVDDVPPPEPSTPTTSRKHSTRPPGPNAGESSGGESKSKAPVIAGVIIAILVLVGIVFAIWFLAIRRRRNKSSPPPVQFNAAEGGGMQIGQPTPAPNQVYETPDTIANGLQHGFVNQVYNDINAPPPYYETSPVRKPAASAYEVSPQHVYETPDGTQAGALPPKEHLPDGAVVDIIPPKQVGFQNEKSLKTDAPVKFFHKRGSQNVYEVPVSSTTPDAEAELRLEPPPKFDDAKLHVLREKAATSILPNVPRKKKIDPNANETTEASRSHYQNVGDVTREQSES